MDRSANRSFSLNQPYQSQLQPQTQSHQITTQNGTENSAQNNSVNQSQPPRLTQAFIPQNTAHGLAGLFTNKDEQEAINIKEFSALKISSYSSSHAIQPPSTKPEITKEIFSQIYLAQSKSDLENCMRIVGVSSLQELCEMRPVGTYTVLMLVAQTGNAELTSLLLQSVDEPQKLALMLSDDGLTALMFAINSHAKVVTAMLTNVPNPQQLAEQTNISGVSALMKAAGKGRAVAITALLSGVPNPQQLAEKIDTQGNSALHYAASYGHAPAITAILSDGINKQLLAERQNNFGYSALMLAADKGYVEVIVSIFSAVNNRQQLAEQINNFGQTVLMNGLLSGASTLVITEILESIEDPEKVIFHVNNEGLNSFTYALARENIDAALVIFDKAKDKNALLYKKNNPDQEAAIQMMKPEIQDLFIKNFYEPNH